MKLKELLQDVKGEIENEKTTTAKELIKEKVLEIEELKKALAKAESNLNKLLNTELEELDLDVW